MPCLLRGELPFDPRARLVALALPRVDLGDEDFTLANSAIQALTAQYADLDFHHVEPARMFRRVVKLQALKDAVCLGRREGFVQGLGCDLADFHYPDADRIRVVMDNLSTHIHQLHEI